LIWDSTQKLGFGASPRIEFGRQNRFGKSEPNMMENNETTFKGVEALLRVKKAKPNRHIVSLIPLYKAPKMNENRAFALFCNKKIK
jgi:hypothetical protein